MNTDSALAALAAYLNTRRAAILAAWSRAAEHDPQITTSATLSRTQFYDHIPDMLEALERLLVPGNVAAKQTASDDEAANAREHGLQRWQQGYNQQEVMREWVWLNACLTDELATYAAARQEIPADAMTAAWRVTTEFLVTGMSESVAQFARLYRAEASARVQALEDAHEQLESLARERARAWHEATHDLRGNLSIVQNVATVLQIRETGTTPPQEPLRMLERSVDALNALLDDLTTQARLDAGQEQRVVQPFDAAATLSELCADSQPIAAERGLKLSAKGPASLPVEGDKVKVRRIAQNLLLNALQYTVEGGVVITWENSLTGPDRWLLSVQDTGPGLDTSGNAPITVALDAATRDMQEVGKRADAAGVPSDDPEKAATLPSRSAPTIQDVGGEGIGLAIVKRLCELLDASLELQTEPGRGSTFRVTFPSTYPKG